MKINFNTGNFYNNIPFRAGFSENSKTILFNEHEPTDIYTVMQIAKQNSKDDVLVLRNASRAPGYYTPELHVYTPTKDNNYKHTRSIYQPRRFSYYKLYELYCSDYGISKTEQDKMLKKYTKELYEKSGCNQFDDKIKELEKKSQKIKQKIEKLKEINDEINSERNDIFLTQVKLKKDYVKKAVDREIALRNKN